MSQNTNVLLAPVTYNRSDYTALRAHCLKIPIAKIAELYYSDDSRPLQQKCPALQSYCGSTALRRGSPKWHS
jgi:hypothetical protein